MITRTGRRIMGNQKTPKELIAEFQLDTGMSNVNLANYLEVGVNTLGDWKAGRSTHSPLLFRALRDLRSELVSKLVKGKIPDTPTCPFCGEEIALSEVARGRFTVSHRCNSGLTIKLRERPREEALYALTKIVGVSNE
jgi:hypothetical protein